MWWHVYVCLSYSCCPVDVPAVAGVISVLISTEITPATAGTSTGQQE